MTHPEDNDKLQDYQQVLDSLPLRKTAGSKWMRTRTTPCTILMLCSSCQNYLTPDSFSTCNSKRTRMDIFGISHVHECRSCANERFLKYDHRKKLLNSARQRAKSKGLDFDLTLDDIVIPEFCPALGIKLSPSVGEGRKSLTKLEASPSIDRVDSNKGYVKGNVCVISLRANNIKKNATLEELRALVKHMQKEQHNTIEDVSNRLMEQAQQMAQDKMLSRIQHFSMPPEGACVMQCSRCGIKLPLDQFSRLRHKNKGRLCPDGTTRKDCCKDCSVELYLSIDHRSKLLNAARKRSKSFGLEFNITKEDVPIPEYCPVLGIKLNPSIGKGRKNLNELAASPSIDRIDSLKGYVKGNVQVISFRANNLKSDATAGEIQALVDYIEKFRKDNCMIHPFSNATTGGAR